MKQSVTVNEAINKGKIRLILFPLLIIIGFIALGLFLQENQLIGKWAILICLIAGIIFGWFTWSCFVVKWKIWAFENVRNVNELKRKAIENNLIWNDGSWFEKTEFKNQGQKAKLKSLENKFLEKDLYHDDINVPKETVIYYSRTNLLFILVMLSGACCIGITIIWLDQNFIGLVLILISIWGLFETIKKLRDKNPQIIISDKGIQIKNEKLISWNKIFNDRVYTQNTGKSSKNYLAFNNEKIEIGDLKIKFEELENLLNVYRVRFEKNNP